MVSFDSKVQSLLDLYGRSDDPLWNLRVRPQLEAALNLASHFESDDYDDLSGAKLLLAYPQVAALALEANGHPSGLESLADPSLAKLSSEAFTDPLRFLTPPVLASLKPLIVLIAQDLGVSPVELWPEGFQVRTQPTADPQTTTAREALKRYLGDLEPYSPLLGLILKGQSEEGWLFWPHYQSKFLVFGGAQYFMGRDGGMLCAPNVYSFDEIVAAYRGGERSPLQAPPEPEDAPEAWARNCGSTSRAVIEALRGSTEASARGTLGHWENGQFADGETLNVMLSALGLNTPPPLVEISTIPGMVTAMPTGAHFVVGIRWAGTTHGHWFNVRNNGAQAEWIDGQTGTSGIWPPPFLERAEPQALIIRPLDEAKARKFLNF